MTPTGSRLSQVANERRRQRRQQAANKIASDSYGAEATASQEDKEKNVKNEQIQIGLACAPTSSTFDDSTISSKGTWTLKSAHSAISEESFNFAPPMVILSPSRKCRDSNRNKAQAVNNPNTPNAPKAAATTKKTLATGLISSRRVKIYDAKLSGSASVGTLATAASSSSATTNSLSSPKPPAATPRNSNLSSKAKSTNTSASINRLRNSASILSSSTTATSSSSTESSLSSPKPATTASKNRLVAHRSKLSAAQLSKFDKRKTVNEINTYNDDSDPSVKPGDIVNNKNTPRSVPGRNIRNTPRNRIAPSRRAPFSPNACNSDSTETTGNGDDSVSGRSSRNAPRNRITPRSRAQFSPNACNSDSMETGNGDDNISFDNSLAIAAKDEKISLLTSERDKLREDIATFKNKLNKAIEAKGECALENDTIISELEDRIDELWKELELSKTKALAATASAGELTHRMTSEVGDMSKQLELSKSQTRCAELKTKELEGKLKQANKLKDGMQRNQMDEVQKAKEKDNTICELEHQIDGLCRELEHSKSQLRSATEAAEESAEKMADSEAEVEQMTKQLDLSKTQTRCAELKIKDSEGKMFKATKKKDEAHKNQMGQIQKVLAELRSQNEKLTQELSDTKDQWDDCIDELDRIKAENEETHARQAQREAHLEQSINGLQNEKRDALAEAKRELADAKCEISAALADKKSLNDQLDDMANELQMQRNSCDSVKQHHAKIVEGLKSDLAKARQLREESASSLHQDMETMKSEHDEHIKHYQDEIENLRDQLQSTKHQADFDRKEWTNNAQPTYERNLQSVTKEKEELATKLEQANKDILALKSVRDKDIEMLESELDKTYKSKVEIEVEFKDTKRQLHNALRNLDELQLDGGKMRSDLEGAMSDFTKERAHYQKEINQLQTCNVEQKCQITELTRDRTVYEDNCTMLQERCNMLEDRCLALETRLMNEMKSVQTLEDKLMKEMRSNKQHDEEYVSSNEMLKLEIQYLKSKLENTEEEMASRSQAALAREEKMASSNQLELTEHKKAVSQLQTEKSQLKAQIEQHKESIESLQQNQQDSSSELSQAQQMIQALKSKEESAEILKQNQRESAAHLSRAQQTIQILKSKERYLESRVESLSAQISQTVQDYEMRLTHSNSSDGSHSGRSKSDAKQKVKQEYEMRLTMSNSGDSSHGERSNTSHQNKTIQRMKSGIVASRAASRK
ncbi:hypothetical protein ACHAWF_014312 [Thalassiosira exigua]